MNQVLDEIEQHVPALRRYARALTRDVTSADDLVQDCLERALRKKALWRPTGSVRSWLFRILINVHRNQLRSPRYKTELHPVETLPEPSTPAPQTSRLALAEVARALDKIDPDQAQALLLVVVEGLTYEEAAHSLDIPIGTLMSRLSRARAALKKMTDAPETPRLRTVK